MTWRAGLLVALGLSLAAGLGAGRQGSDPGPHAFMDDESRCAGCHRVEPDGADWILDPHLFTRSVVEVCRACHPPEQTGRSHPVGVDPRAALALRRPPAQLPLHWSDEARAEVMTCGTCHNPHLPRLGERKIHSLQRSAPGGDGYLTYFLRMRGANPREGFTPLCRACHPDL